MALARRRPPHGWCINSDRGSQYASGEYQQVLDDHGIVCSMSRRGYCWDTAVAESFFATLKVELTHKASWFGRKSSARRRTRCDAQVDWPSHFLGSSFRWRERNSNARSADSFVTLESYR
jgi:transposase InsO family protein